MPLFSAAVGAKSLALFARPLLLMPGTLAALLPAGVHVLLTRAAGSAIEAAPLLALTDACRAWQQRAATTAREPALPLSAVSLLGFLLAGAAGHGVFWHRDHTRVKVLCRFGIAALAATQVLDGAAAGQTLLCVLFFELGPRKSILNLSDLACATNVFHGARIQLAFTGHKIAMFAPQAHPGQVGPHFVPLFVLEAIEGPDLLAPGACSIGHLAFPDSGPIHILTPQSS